VKAGQDRYVFYFGVTKDTHWEDSIWVVVDRLTKSAHFIPIKVKDLMNKLARLYVQNIVHLHGVHQQSFRTRTFILPRDFDKVFKRK
jgi:hypothetical protein